MSLVSTDWLDNNPKATKVVYPGLPSHSQFELASQQQFSPDNKPVYGSMISFEVDSSIDLVDNENKDFIKNIFLCTGSFKKVNSKLNLINIDNQTSEEINKIREIANKLKLSHGDKIYIDFSELDEKNYHNGIRFTFFAKNVRGEIASGGRYRIQNNNINATATGFTCYMDSLLRASSTKILHKNILVPFNISKKNLQLFIKKGYSILRYTGEKNINKKLARNQKCQFYLENNKIKKT